MWDNFKAMPKLLKFFTAHAIACVVFFFGSVIPHGAFSIDGHRVTYHEWWGSGAGIYTAMIGILLPLGGWFMLKRSYYARSYYLGTLVVGLIFPYLLLKHFRESDSSYGLAAIGTAAVAAVAWYLYGKETVRDYFSSNKALKEDAAKTRRAP
jgi:hypothetical protein